MEKPSNSLARTLDAVESKQKVTGVGAIVEIVAYPRRDNAGIAGHPLNGKDELLQAIDYLYERLHREAVEAAS
jgi:hypothetical protein